MQVASPSPISSLKPSESSGETLRSLTLPNWTHKWDFQLGKEISLCVHLTKLKRAMSASPRVSWQGRGQRCGCSAALQQMLECYVEPVGTRVGPDHLHVTSRWAVTWGSAASFRVLLWCLNWRSKGSRGSHPESKSEPPSPRPAPGQQLRLGEKSVEQHRRVVWYLRNE